MKGISARLYTGFFVVISIMGLLAVLSISNLAGFRRDIIEISSHHARELLIFGKLERLLFKMKMDLEEISFGAGIERVDSYMGYARSFKEEVAKLLYHQDTYEDAYTRVIEEILRDVPSRVDFKSVQRQDLPPIAREKQIRLEADEIREAVVDPLLRECADLIFLEDNEIVNVAGLAMRRSATATSKVIVLSFSAFILGVAIAVRTSRSITRPIKHLESVSVAVAEGNRSIRSGLEGRDEIGRLSRAFDQMVDSLERVLGEQEEFLSDTSHNLLTPLTVIRGHLQVMRRSLGGGSGGDEEVFCLVFKELARIEKILNDLLLLSRSSTSDMLALRYVRADIFLAEVFRKAEVLGQRAWFLENSPPVSIRCDTDLITTSLLELAKNAVQHTKTGDRISLAARLSAEGICFEVSDTGSGIPEEEKDKIFNRFYRGEKRILEKASSGLGLSIVQSVARAHKGRITVESTIGKGSTFRLWIPTDPFSSL